ncbi:hypothetical protein [Helicobacter bilis]|uniref:hypothetical protein n=1 Tax=Helicobacter bilis TaxID=37372 RepID=UPI0026F2393D|nr:hypothetical protein [Helicobacter bilis]
MDIANDITSRIDSTLSSINTKTGNTTQKSIIYVGGTELPRGAKKRPKYRYKNLNKTW